MRLSAEACEMLAEDAPLSGLAATQGPRPWSVADVLAWRTLLVQLQMLKAEDFHLGTAKARFEQLRRQFETRVFKADVRGTDTFTNGIRAQVVGDFRTWWDQVVPTLFDRHERTDAGGFSKREDFGDLIDRTARAAAKGQRAAIVDTLDDAGMRGYAARFEAPEAAMFAGTLDRNLTGQRFAPWRDSFTRETINRMAGILGQSMVQGRSVRDTARAFARAADIDFGRAEAVARTTMHSAAMDGQRRWLDGHSRFIEAVQWQATFDTLTCPICAGLHGRKWPPGEEKHTPPIHIRCRCTLVPVLKRPEKLGLDLVEREPHPMFARKIDPQTGQAILGTAGWGTVPSTLSFQDWLKSAPEATQREMLGRGRWELWSRGELELRQLSTRTGKLVSLRELESRLERRRPLQAPERPEGRKPSPKPSAIEPAVRAEMNRLKELERVLADQLEALERNERLKEANPEEFKAQRKELEKRESEARKGRGTIEKQREAARTPPAASAAITKAERDAVIRIAQEQTKRFPSTRLDALFLRVSDELGIDIARFHRILADLGEAGRISLQRVDDPATFARALLVVSRFGNQTVYLGSVKPL